MTNVTLADVGRDARAGCAPGYGGVLCSWCEEKFWMNHGACEECSNVGGGAPAAVWIAAAILGVIGVLTASFMLSNRGADDAAKIHGARKGLTLVHLSGPRSKPYVSCQASKTRLSREIVSPGAGRLKALQGDVKTLLGLAQILGLCGLTLQVRRCTRGRFRYFACNDTGTRGASPGAQYYNI